MAGTLEYQYRDLLNPIKDPEKSFAINISQLLADYVSELTSGKRAPNFNSAALLLQGSASIYGKKVDYLHNLAHKLVNNLMRQKNALNGEKQTVEKKSKEKEKKEDKSINPFLPTDIKSGRNLSCLKKKNVPKSVTKKLTKRLKSSNIPVLLLTADSDDKGIVFNDTRGEPVGNQSDYAVNLCHMTNSGWLLLPTVNPDLVPLYDDSPDYYDDFEVDSDYALNNVVPGTPPGSTDVNGSNEIFSPDAGTDIPNDEIMCTPDEGIGSSQGTDDAMDTGSIPDSTPSADKPSEDLATPSQDGSFPPSTDEGIGSQSREDVESHSSGEGIENLPTNGVATDTPALRPIRQSVRSALKQCQLAQEDDPLSGPIAETHLVVRKEIQKRKTRNLPNKLKNSKNDDEDNSLYVFCARTFFTFEEKTLKNSYINFQVAGFSENTGFLKRLKERLATVRNSSKKDKTIDPVEDEVDINVDRIDDEEVETLQDGEEDNDDTLCVPFDDNDVQVENDPALCPVPPEDVDNAVPAVDIPEQLPSPDISHIAFQERERYNKEIQQYIQNSEIIENVHAWEKSVKPFLEEMDKRESFDINLYGSRILNSFEDSNRKQTMTFKDFCRNKQKWEIHRYFMALLPLANIGNVAIESERKEDGTDEIFVTLLSRKMHHKELEEFGHNDGSHS